MSTGRTDEFRKEAVRIALTSGLSRSPGPERTDPRERLSLAV